MEYRDNDVTLAPDQTYTLVSASLRVDSFSIRVGQSIILNNFR